VQTNCSPQSDRLSSKCVYSVSLNLLECFLSPSLHQHYAMACLPVYVGY
jgi:hypothetical protein